jgi:threonine/homoserine/homoserine lactone efflux protein
VSIVDIAAIGAFWLVALLLIVTPGADWAFTLSAAMRGNAVVPAVAGLVAGYAVMTMVVAAVSAARSPAPAPH